MLLKYFALIFMIFDHIIIVYLPDLLFLRPVTGFGFCLFAYMIAEGFCYTKNIKKYLLKIFITAIISQPFFYIICPVFRLNDLFTLAFGLFFLFLYKKFGYISFLFLIIGFVLKIFHLYVFVVPIFYFFRKDDKKLFIMLAVFHSSLYFLGLFQLSNYLMSFLLLPVIRFCELYKNFFLPALPRSFFYVIYPLHLFVLNLFKV